MKKHRWIRIATISLSIIWSFGAWATDDPYVVIFLVDGARGDLIHELAAQGRLPHIKELFIDGGLDVEHATTVFPTTSTNAYQSFMTGLFPGHAGIPYLARFSRHDKESVEYLSLKGIKILNADLLNWYQLNDPDIPFRTTQASLFDTLGDLRTSSIYATFQRGATVQKPFFPLRAAWDTFVLGDHEALDKLAYKDIRRLFSKPQEQIPHLNLVALLAIDILAHQEGARAPRVLDHFETLDRMIGDFWDLLNRRGLANKTYLVLVGDHGNHDISERSYLRERLIRHGVAIRSRHMRPPYELAINARGVSCAILSVAGPDGWKSSPTLEDFRHVPIHKRNQPRSGVEGEAPYSPACRQAGLPIEGALLAPITNPTRKKGDMDLIEYLRRQPETDLLLVHNDSHHVRIFGANGESEVTQFWSGGRFWYGYRILNGPDPLHYTDDPRLARIAATHTPLTADQWLPLTATKEYGDAIVQIGQIFTDGRVGDMMIVPKHNWVFRHEKANTHGGLSQDDIHIPIMMHGPTITPQKIPFGRSVDVMPTILSWFGRDIPLSDGRHLLRPRSMPTHEEAVLAARELAVLTSPHPILRRWRTGTEGEGKTRGGLLSAEFKTRTARIAKLEGLAGRCRAKRPEDRLTRPDRPKKMRASTCEVVDLALKTAYGDLQRLKVIRGGPVETQPTVSEAR